LALCERYFKANTHNKVVNSYLIFEKIQNKSMEQVQIKCFGDGFGGVLKHLHLYQGTQPLTTLINCFFLGGVI
jgi:hypothetical protein